MYVFEEAFSKLAVYLHVFPFSSLNNSNYNMLIPQPQSVFEEIFENMKISWLIGLSTAMITGVQEAVEPSFLLISH